jgi:hypothetical protein
MMLLQRSSDCAATGGHFAAFEQPDLFVSDVRAYFRMLR